MELVDAHFSEPGVEDAIPNDVKWGYYCPRLVDHSKLKPIEVLTSFGPEIEMQLAIAGGVQALHDVGPLLLSPLTKLGISQESTNSSSFANYRFQKITSTFGFANGFPHLELVLQKIPRILSLVNANY
jgi:hypothetical protein